jgi:hypothetical protein
VLATHLWSFNVAIFQVELSAPAINEIVVTAAESEEEAISIAVYSAVQRMLKAGTATAQLAVMPDGTPTTD